MGGAVELVQAAVGVLQVCGVAATQCGHAITIPASDTITMHARKGTEFWTVELLTSDGVPVPIEADMPEPVPADSQDAELIAVYVLRSLLRVGQKNRVAHPYVKH